jgi:hypothetical protein
LKFGRVIVQQETSQRTLNCGKCLRATEGELV